MRPGRPRPLVKASGDRNALRERRAIVVAAALALLALGARHPTADLRLITHDAADPAPHRMQAAIDLGLVGVKLLVTWSAGQLR